MKKFDCYLPLLEIVYVGLEKIIGNLSDVEESLMKMELFLIMKTEGVQLSDMVVQHSAYSEELRGVFDKMQNEIMM